MSLSPVYAFLENPSMIDFPGHLCGLFFLSGCNFKCGFCHNATLMGAKKTGLPWERMKEVCKNFKSNWVDAVCITGGEPTLSEDLPELIEFFREYGFLIKLDSNGGRPDFLKKCFPLIDAIAMDVKAGLPGGYNEIAGFPDDEKIKQSIKFIMESEVDYEFRTTVIEPFHTDEQMLAIGELIKGAKNYCLQAFIPQDTLPDKKFREIKRTTPERLREIEKLMKPFVENIVVHGA